jgi:hypothetical protein
MSKTAESHHDLRVDDEEIARLVSPDRKHLWVVAAPKSGSIWLTTILSEILSWPSLRLVHRSDLREQEIDLRQLVMFPRENVLSPPLHTTASKSTLDILRIFRIKPVIQVRSILDTVASLRDHLTEESLALPFAFFDEDFRSLKSEIQLSAVIDLCVPWYLNFYVSWFCAERDGLCDPLWMTYENLLCDTVTSVEEVLNFIGESRSHDEIHHALVRSQNNAVGKNVGTVGRGAACLTEEHLGRIRGLMSYYPRVDFSRLGF